MLRLAKNIVFYIIVPPLMAASVILCVPFALLPAKYRYTSHLYHIIVHACSRLILFFGFIKYKIYGKRNLPTSQQPSVFIINHSSSLDIPVFELLLKAQPRIWMLKSEYTNIPVWGFVLNRMHTALKRESLTSARLALNQAITTAGKYGCHVAIAPEGRRYTDGKIHKFFSGFAIIAQELNRPVVPIAIAGLNRVLPAKSFFIDSNAQPIKISIGEEINYKDFQTRQDFIDYTQRWFETELEKLNKNNQE
jgi:1-acyl-sn-glycerol-3-phosphate acyltransferase